MRIKSGNIVCYVNGNTLFSEVVLFLTSIGKIRCANAVVLAFAAGKEEINIGI